MSKIFQPIGDYVIIEKIENIDKTSGNQLIIPEGVQDDSSLAKVIAVGTGIRSLLEPDKVTPLIVKEGDLIIVPRFNHKLEWKGKMYYIVKESEIYTKVDNE